MSHDHWIAATCYNRPERLQRLLESVAAAQERLPAGQRWKLCISIEPGPVQDAVQAVVEACAARLQITSRINRERKGVRHNPHDNIEWCLEQGADVVLLLEDDLQIDPLALQWCAMLAAGPLREPQVLGANLLMTTCCSESIHMPAWQEWASLSDLVLRTRFFSSYGLLFTRRQWQQHLQPNWFTDSPRMENWEGGRAVGWDVALNRYLLASPGLEMLQSLVPRVTHDGSGGTHVTDEFQARSFDNIAIDRDGRHDFTALKVVDALADLDAIPSAAARMYVNLSRHLWTQQASHLRFRHLFDDELDSRVLPRKVLTLGSYRYTVFRQRIRRS